jgi:acyl carrier protein
MTDIRGKVLQIIEKETGLASGEIDPDRDFDELVSLDSMQMVSIASRIEKTLDIELPLSVMNVKTLNEFIALLEENFPREKEKKTVE